MAREDHQPVSGAVQRERIEVGELHRVCGRSVGIVLALDDSTTPLIVQSDDPESEPVVCKPPDGKTVAARPLQVYNGVAVICATLESMRRAQFTELFVVTVPSLSSEVSVAVNSYRRKGSGTTVQIVEVDQRALVERTRENADFEMFGLSFGILEVSRALAQSALDGYDNVVIVNADNVRISTEHVYELCKDACDHEDIDAIASWISWLRRPPYLFTREFLEDMEDRGLTFGKVGSLRPAPILRVRDHVFGEEKLASSPAPSESAAKFLEGCTISALEAVGMARYSAAHPDEPLQSPRRSLSLMGPASRAELGWADKVLVDIAKEVIAKCEGLEYAEQIYEADAFGKRCRMDFPLLCDKKHAGVLAYLDSAATSQRVDVALKAQRDYDEHENANVYRGAYELSAKSTFTFNDARERLESYIGAQRRQTVFTANTTAAINLVAQSWGEWNIDEGDVIVVPLAEHHSNLLPFLQLAQRKGAHVEYVPYGPDGRIDQQAYRAALESKPKLVCVAHVGNVFGIMEPVCDMARAAHEVNARFLLDAAQSFAHVKLDVATLGADWVAMSAHKAYGPMGIGALWISDDVFDEMDPLGGGGGSVSHVSTESYYLRPKAIQYEWGTPPVSQAVGWAAAIGYMEALGIGEIAKHDEVLTRYLVDGLDEVDGVSVLGDHSGADGWTGLVSFSFRGVAPAELAGFLGSLGVAIRAGGHCALPLHASLGMIGSGRVSIGAYTTRDDIDAALVALKACRRAFGN